jgi:adenosyl cobinamide kinase/adenosyl cobinamide phosphate guanylyltransferase
MLTLIGGGARSGKSSYALSLGNSAIDSGKRALFVATAEAVDVEMEQRIAKHKVERRSEYDLIEEPRELAQVLNQARDYDIVIVDCLTLWLSNLMLENIKPDFDDVIDAGRSINSSIVFVTNETGEGIVPMHPVSRKFRDLSGQMNVAFAKNCDQVVSMKFGIPMVIKGNNVE